MRKHTDRRYSPCKTVVEDQAPSTREVWLARRYISFEDLDVSRHLYALDALAIGSRIYGESLRKYFRRERS